MTLNDSQLAALVCTVSSGNTEKWTENGRGWRWQKCYEMAFLQRAPAATGSNTATLRSPYLTLDVLLQQCDDVFGLGTSDRCLPCICHGPLCPGSCAIGSLFPTYHATSCAAAVALKRCAGCSRPTQRCRPAVEPRTPTEPATSSLPTSPTTRGNQQACSRWRRTDQRPSDAATWSVVRGFKETNLCCCCFHHAWPSLMYTLRFEFGAMNCRCCCTAGMRRLRPLHGPSRPWCLRPRAAQGLPRESGTCRGPMAFRSFVDGGQGPAGGACCCCCLIGTSIGHKMILTHTAFLEDTSTKGFGFGPSGRLMIICRRHAGMDSGAETGITSSLEFGNWKGKRVFKP